MAIGAGPAANTPAIAYQGAALHVGAKPIVANKLEPATETMRTTVI